MKQKRHTTEQIIHKLRKADALLASGTHVPDVCRQIGISEGTYHRWRARYDGSETQAVKRLRTLVKEHELLNREAFSNLAEARVLMEEYRSQYSNQRPHGSLGYLTPAEYHSHTDALITPGTETGGMPSFDGGLPSASGEQTMAFRAYYHSHYGRDAESAQT